MPVLILSANALLREVVAETLSGAGLGVKRVEPAGSMAAIRREHPPVIVADMALAPDILADLLATARALQGCRVIIIDASCNDIVVIDLRCRAMTRAGDLVEAVRAAMTPDHVTW